MEPNKVKYSPPLISRLKIHLIAWLLFIFYEVVINEVLIGATSNFGNYAVFYSCNILLFYFHAHIAMPASQVKSKKAIWLLPLIILAEIIVYIPFVLGIARVFMEYFGVTMVNPPDFKLKNIVSLIWRCVYFLFFSTAYYFVMNYIKERKTLQEAEEQRLLMIIENQKVQTELVKSQHAHLKAQINPHFLFNTLSFIYANARKTAPEAAEAIMSLSEMMRYSMQENERTYTGLGLEIEQVENLIHLHQIRSGNTLLISLNYPQELLKIQVIPLVLLTLVENMFKHGNLQNAAHPATIDIYQDQSFLIMKTRNLIEHKATHTSHHIGMENIEKRLNILYGDEASMQIKKENNFFEVTVAIKIS